MWGTLASVGTFIVITATAIAALVQLRHMRAANQIATWQQFASAYEGSELRHAFEFVRTDLNKRLEDPTFCQELREGRTERTKHPEITICNLFDQWGLYYRSGAIDRAGFMRVNAGIVVGFWKRLAPVIALVADPVLGNISFQQFEYLAVQATRWQKLHPAGDYPAGAPRMPLPEVSGAVSKPPNP
jgi:hypothetical protein